jgi:acetylornithine deacetylase
VTTATDLTAQLVAIDSVNPALVPGGAGESEAAAFVARWAEEQGLEVGVIEETPGRPSVLVTARGSGGGRTLLLCGHLDTVNVDGMDRPHEPRRDGDRLYGRGGYDMKAGVAAALVAAVEASRQDLRGDVVVACVADEEHSSIGIQEALRHVRADAAIVTEPTELDVIVAHRGFIWAEIEIAGVAAHGSRPHLGVDAIVKAAPVLAGIGALDARLIEETSHPLLGRGSAHAGTISGGIEPSSYPGRCTITVERRTLPGETEATFAGELSALLDEARAADPALEASFAITLVREPFMVDATDEIVTVTREAAGEELGRAPEIVGASYWADAAFIATAGIPTVMFGPVGEGAHALEEWVSVSSTESVARALTAVAARICA